MKKYAAQRASLDCLVVLALTLTLLSCGGTGNTTQKTISDLPHRAFVSNPFQPTGSFSTPLINIVDASNDKLTNFFVSVGSSSPEPERMFLSPNQRFLMVYSASNNSVQVIDTQTEKVAQSGNRDISATTLSGTTESILFGADNATGYAAVPNATVTGQTSLGAVEVINLFNSQVSATVPIARARYLIGNSTSSRLLVFSDESDGVAEVATSLVGTSTPPVTSVSGFDRPVGAILESNDTTTYVLNCGLECGGTSASVQVFDLNSQQLIGSPIPVPGGATAAFLSGKTLYVAGSTPGTLCTAATAAAHCGTLSVIDLNTKSVTATAEITDGYHTLLSMGSRSKLFVGARNCSNVAPSTTTTESRGCLSIYDAVAAAVTIPTPQGDVTGLQAVPTRDRVYVAQGGVFKVYDTVTLQNPPPGEQGTVAAIAGRPYDIKIIY